VLGALGSQTVATFDARGELALSYQNGSSAFESISDVTWFAAAPTHANPEHDMSLPQDAAPSGALSPALLLGTPVFLVPYGAETSARAVLATGDAVLVNRLGDVACDAITTPLDLSGNTSGVQRFACLRGGVLNLGELHLTRVPQ
jgi:hypothetical protein